MMIVKAMRALSSFKHLALMKGLNPALIGLHLNITEIILATADTTIKMTTPQMMTRNPRFGKILRYRRRTETLVKDSEAIVRAIVALIAWKPSVWIPGYRVGS